MLVMSMIFTSHAFVTFAEGVDNAETTVSRGELDEVAPSGVTIPEEDTEETTVEADTKETTVGADIIRPKDEAEEHTETTDYAEEPEEDVEEKETTTDETEAIEDYTVLHAYVINDKYDETLDSLFSRMFK